MKKLLIVLLLILSASGLFAKDKTFFEKSSKYSNIGFYESKNLKATNGYKYYININEDDFEGGRLIYVVLSNDYDKIKKFLTDMYKAGNRLSTPLWAFYPDYYSFLNDDIEEVHKSTEIDSENNMINEFKVWILE